LNPLPLTVVVPPGDTWLLLTDADPVRGAGVVGGPPGVVDVVEEPEGGEVVLVVFVDGQDDVHIFASMFGVGAPDCTVTGSADWIVDLPL
jgi:hypothetical protein